MKRVLAQHNRQTLMLEKSLREREQRLTISEHRKRNLELQMVKIEDEERRKIGAVSEAIKCLTNSFGILNMNVGVDEAYKHHDDVVEHKEEDTVDRVIKKKKETNVREKVVDDTIIEIMEDDEDEIDFMRDHN